MPRRVLSNPLTGRSQDLLRAFRLLVHAEIEAYVEQLVIRKAVDSLDLWRSGRKASKCLLSIVAFCEMELGAAPPHLAAIGPRNDLEERVNRATNTFIKRIRTKNNGIKEENLVPLLIPIGLDSSEVSQTLLNNLSSFGRNRGEIAHNSSKVVQPISPIDELSIIDQILSDLKDLDAAITTIK